MYSHIWYIYHKYIILHTINTVRMVYSLYIYTIDAKNVGEEH